MNVVVLVGVAARHLRPLGSSDRRAHLCRRTFGFAFAIHHALARRSHDQPGHDLGCLHHHCRRNADRARDKSARCAATSLSTTGSLAPDCDCLPHHVHSVVPWLCSLHQGVMAALQPRHDAATRRRKLFSRFLTPVPLAVLEEAYFAARYSSSYFDHCQQRCLARR